MIFIIIKIENDSKYKKKKKNIIVGEILEQF